MSVGEQGKPLFAVWHCLSFDGWAALGEESKDKHRQTLIYRRPLLQLSPKL